MTSVLELREEPAAFAAPALDVLRRSGPLTIAELRDALARESTVVDEEALRGELETRGDVVEFGDERWGHVPSLADGVVLTHVVSTEELDLGLLAAEGDLDLWARLADGGLPLAGGGELRTVYPTAWGPAGATTGLAGATTGLAGATTGLAGATTALAGPAGWLDGCRAGALVGLRLAGGTLEVLPEVVLDASAFWPDEGRPLAYKAGESAGVALDWYDADPETAVVPGAPIDDVLLALRREHPRALRVALPPLSGLLSRCGLEVWRGHVGLPGAPWHGDDAWLGETGREAVRGWRLTLAVHRCFGKIHHEELVDVAAAARAPELLALLELLGGDLARDPEREPVAEAMADAVTGPLVAVPLYLRACAAEGRGDVLAAERLLEAALGADPGLVVALEDLAWYRSDRGDASGAEQLFRRAGTLPTHPGRWVLRGFLRAPEMPGRNRPCACGSGRKHKLCHGAGVRHPFPARADWLWAKLVSYALRPRQREVIYGYAALLAGADGDPVWTALRDPLAHDLALFEGGGLARFLDERGDLLPDDERGLARSWLDSRRRLLEVVEVRHGHGLRCRDLVAGEEVYVRDRSLTTQALPLDLMYGRPLPDGAGELRVRDDVRCVPRAKRTRLLDLLRTDPSGEEIALFAAAGAARLP